MMMRHAARFLAIVVLLSGCSLLERVLVRPPSSGVDLNLASRDEIAELPGLGEVDAERIIEHRPYDEIGEIVQRGVVSPEQFEKFANRVYVSRPSALARAPVRGD